MANDAVTSEKLGALRALLLEQYESFQLLPEDLADELDGIVQLVAEQLDRIFSVQ